MAFIFAPIPKKKIALGDKDTDMIAGLNAGVQTRIIVGKGESQNATHRVKNLKEALEILID